MATATKAAATKTAKAPAAKTTKTAATTEDKGFTLKIIVKLKIPNLTSLLISKWNINIFSQI